MSSLPFGFVYDERMLKHKCAYDPTMAESPDRMRLIYQRLVKEGQLEDAVHIPARPATDDEILLNHPQELIDELESLKTTEDSEEFCRDKEMLWMSEHSMEAARLAIGGAIDMVKGNVEGKIGNGFAIIRPPGHHSWGKLPQGYCIFNNVAVAAKYAVERLGVGKVAIIDFDIHPGNGTYLSVKDDPRIHFTSFHIYIHGAFWPFTKDFDYDTAKNQLFVPLNGAMNSEGDYLSSFHHVILPVLREWKPDYIFISAGFDAGYYDAMQSMGQGIKGHGYGHIARQLNELCPGRTLAFLEGGYFAQCYVECAHMMVKGLKGDNLPAFDYPQRIKAPLRETILNLIHHHAKHWKCMEKKLSEVQKQQASQRIELGFEPFIPAPRLFIGQGMRSHWDEVTRLRAARTRDWFPSLNDEQTKEAIGKIDEYIKKYDYTKKVKTPKEDELLNQLVWDEEARAQSFVLSAEISLVIYNQFHDYMTGKADHMLICDRELLRKAKGEESSSRS